MNGVIIIDKPEEYTSFDVVAVMRRLCKQKKIGHTGTLDPMATGVLVMLLGNATKAQDLLPESDKEYKASFKLGITTDTLDITGEVIERKEEVEISKNDIEEIIKKYEGEINQVPPMYSAVKKDGKRLYELARKGIEVDRSARKVRIDKIELEKYDEESKEGSLRIRCSKGTYIRSLIDDIGRNLKAGGILIQLRRTMACGYRIEESITLEELKGISERGEVEKKIISIDSLFKEYKMIQVSEKQSQRFRNGGGLEIERTTLNRKRRELKDEEKYRIYSNEKEFIGLGKISLEKSEITIHKLF